MLNGLCLLDSFSLFGSDVLALSLRSCDNTGPETISLKHTGSSRKRHVNIFHSVPCIQMQTMSPKLYCSSDVSPWNNFVATRHLAHLAYCSNTIMIMMAARGSCRGVSTEMASRSAACFGKGQALRSTALRNPKPKDVDD